MTAVPNSQTRFRWSSSAPRCVLLVAAAYYVTGRLALLLALPPAHFAPIWPAAGIALASVLLAGRRVWPGIWLGSFLLHLTSAEAAGSGAAPAIAALIALGAALQALAGGALLERWVGRPLLLGTPKSVGLFLLLAGPMASVVGATLGVGSLLLVGAMPATSAAFTWCTWWVGSSIGATVVTPIVLVFFAKPASEWRRQRLSVALPLAMGVTLVMALLAFASPTAASASGWSAVQPGWQAWGLLIACLLLIPAAAGLLLVLAGRNFEVEQRVIELEVERDQLFNLFGDLVCVVGTDGSFRSVNRAFQSTLGHSTDELMSRSFVEFVHPEDRVATLERLQSLIQGSDTLQFENRYSHKDGTWRILAWSCLARPAHLSTLYASARDVTDRSRAENALRASEERFQLAVSGSAVGIWDWNVLTGEEYLSPRWKELLGYGDDELLNTVETWDSLVHPEDREQAKLAVEKHFAKHAPYEVEYRLRHKDGEYRWYHARGQAVWDESGRATRMAGSLMDIHDKKLAEGALVKSNASLADLNKKLAGQNRQLHEITERAHRFVDDVSHEFRTPLTVIKEFTSIIGDGIGGPVTDQQGEWLRIIDVATVDLNQMVEDFLDSSKLRARLLRIERRPHNVEDLLSGVRRMMARKAEARSIKLVEDIAPGLPAVFADEEKVRRIIMNLVSNAIKFSPDGGEIRLVAREVDSGDVEIAICDQGPGLSEADMALLFERFRQLPSALAPSIKGFGLGLNIARQLVWLNLGKIHLASEPGRGATFSFTLPPNEPGAIVSRFIERLAERDEPVSSIAALLVTASRPGDGIDATRRFLAATTRPSDVIVETSDGAALIVCGPTESAQGWMERLRAAWAEANAAGRTEAIRGPELRLLGVWPYPGGVDEARACLLSNLSREPVHA